MTGEGSRIRHPLVAEPLLGCGHAVTAQAAVDPPPTAVPGKVTSPKSKRGPQLRAPLGASRPESRDVGSDFQGYGDDHSFRLGPGHRIPPIGVVLGARN